MDVTSKNLAFYSGELQLEQFRQAREARQTTIAAKVQEAAPVEELKAMPEEQRTELTGWYDTSIDHIDILRKPRFSQNLEKLFNFDIHDLIIDRATRTNEADNDTAREVKDEYRRLNRELKQDRAVAEKMAKKLGEGTHRLSNGDVVTVTKDRGGNTTVRISKPDGSTKETAYNEREKGDVRTTSTTPDGRTTVKERQGSTVSRTEGNVKSTYSVDERGRPTRVRQGPGSDDYVKTTVNRDGSTDTKTLIYVPDDPGPGEEDGIYEETHEPPREVTHYRDESAGEAIDELKAKNPAVIDGTTMETLLLQATADADNQAAGREYDDLSRYVHENWSKLTPEAKAKWYIYEKYVMEARAKGQTGISQSSYDKMIREMNDIDHSAQG